MHGTPGTAELQLANPGDADNNRDGPGTAELQLGIPGDADNNREGPGTAELQLGNAGDEGCVINQTCNTISESQTREKRHV